MCIIYNNGCGQKVQIGHDRVPVLVLAPPDLISSSAPASRLPGILFELSFGMTELSASGLAG